MSIFQAIVLGIFQGITEFLPISSSGHLVLIEKIFEKFGQKDFGLSFDIFLHFGTLLAILLYFWHDWLKILKNLFNKKGIFGYLILACLPAAFAGIFLENLVEEFFRKIFFVGIFFIICGGFFIFCEKVYFKKQTKNLEKINWRDAIFVGIIQIFALLPGISRSGSTIGAGMLRGLERKEAARFSFLVGGIIIFGATSLNLVKNLKTGILDNLFFETMAGFLSAAISGYFAIAFLMKFLERKTLYGFALYLLVIGIIIIFGQGKI